MVVYSLFTKVSAATGAGGLLKDILRELALMAKQPDISVAVMLRWQVMEQFWSLLDLPCALACFPAVLLSLDICKLSKLV